MVDVTPPTDRVEPVGIEVEMQRSYLDYAMSVIVGRALPDVRDGLKPVHRRVLYAMFDGGYRPDRGYFKCARVVGDVMGSYHPHGDSAIYDTLVRLAQPWSLRYPLVDGQGNFGSPGNDPAAASRYTECRLYPLAMELLRDIDEDTVEFQPNYDGRNQEPMVLPSRFPNLLVNGSGGIAVGMATNMPPHNLREAAAAVQWALEHPDAQDDELLEACLARVTGPDFPTGALIVGRDGIEQAYRTGRGSIRMRGVVEVEEGRGGAQQVLRRIQPCGGCLRGGVARLERLARGIAVAHQVARAPQREVGLRLGGVGLEHAGAGLGDGGLGARHAGRILRHGRVQLVAGQPGQNLPGHDGVPLLGQDLDDRQVGDLRADQHLLARHQRTGQADLLGDRSEPGRGDGHRRRPRLGWRRRSQGRDRPDQK